MIESRGKENSSTDAIRVSVLVSDNFTIFQKFLLEATFK